MYSYPEIRYQIVIVEIAHEQNGYNTKCQVASSVDQHGTCAVIFRNIHWGKTNTTPKHNTLYKEPLCKICFLRTLQNHEKADFKNKGTQSTNESSHAHTLYLDSGRESRPGSPRCPQDTALRRKTVLCTSCSAPGSRCCRSRCIRSIHPTPPTHHQLQNNTAAEFPNLILTTNTLSKPLFLTFLCVSFSAQADERESGPVNGARISLAQLCRLHASLSRVGPVQFAPPCSPTLHVLVLCLVPSPHVWLQSPHSTHGFQLPSTTMIGRKIFSLGACFNTSKDNKLVL